MVRMFERHNVRKQREIGGCWKMCKLLNNGDMTELVTTVVPSCWESIRGFEDFRGRCKYIKKIRTSAADIRLNFKGVSHTADVFFDGKWVAHHYNAYTEFDVIIENVSEGEHILEVVADNSFSSDSTLHFANDYKSYGGITRPVVLEELCGAYIRFLHITPIKDETGWNAEISVEIDNINLDNNSLKTIVKIENEIVEFHNNEFHNNIAKKCIRFNDVNEWYPESPNLYVARAELYCDDKIIDDLNERFGFREVKVDGNKILLNDKQLYIKGFNRHEEYATLGCAVPENIMSADLDMIADMGANLVRTSHYPNDERFLDMCDERGVLVWEEAHARQIFADKMSNPNFVQQATNGIDEMILNHYNHPSIILWGALNECESYSEIGREAHAFHFKRIKELDKTRPTTTAANKFFKDICHDLPDVLSFNFYPKWYYEHDPVEFLDRVKKYAEELGAVNKPMLISEFGAAAIYGYRTLSEVKWSEERQAEIIGSLINTFKGIDYLSGMIIWQFCDGRIDSEMKEFTTRPKTQNNKGVVDIYRRPKMSYYTVRENFKKIENYFQD